MGMNVRAVLRGKTEQGDLTTLNLEPDYAEGRNAEWAAATPTFSLTMTVRADLAADLETGQEVEVLLNPGSKPSDRSGDDA